MYSFDAPIPGESLTKMPGSTPMEHPPQFTDVNAALEFVWDRFTSPKHATNVILLLKKKVPIEYIVNTILFQGVISGQWTVDVSLLMYQVVFWQIESIAKLKKIKVTLKNPDPKQDDFLSNFVDLLDKPDDTTISPAPAPTSMFKGIS